MKADSTLTNPRPVPEPWDRPVCEFPGLAHLAPPVNRPDDPLSSVVDTFARDSGSGVVFVVDRDDRLVGCIREHALDTDLVTLVLPQRLWSVVRDLETRDVLRAARGRRRCARDLMTPIRSITPATSLKEALAVMARSDASATPLVDEDGRLLGYLRLFEVLAHFAHQVT
jgi:CBS-domain-containing membrane protein